MDLLSKKCVACEGGTPPLAQEEAGEYLKQTPGWQTDEGVKKISREFNFRDFAEAMKFVNKVAEIAESESHHPDVHIFYGRVVVELWTHAVSGLSLNDFILAAKINTLLPL